MIKLGSCAVYGTFVPGSSDNNKKSNLKKHDILKSEYDVISEIGYEFLESTVGYINDMSEEEFLGACEYVKQGGLKIETTNSFIPSRLHITGPDVSKELLSEYVEKSMTRLKALGVSLIVFGSGSARRVPDGFPRDKAVEQIYDFLKICAAQGEKYGICVVIEPLNKNETNIINSVAEGYEYVDSLKNPYIALLADSYHVYKENEDLSSLIKAAPYLKHIHIAEPYNRTNPGGEGGAYLKEFLQVLDTIDYTGNISIECRFNNFISEIAESYKFLKELNVNWAKK